MGIMIVHIKRCIVLEIEMTDLSTMQKLGLAPLEPEQKIGRIRESMDELLEANCLPRWAYVEAEFNTFRAKLIGMIKEIRSIQKCGV